MGIRICTVFIALLLLFCAWPGPVKAQNVTIPDANLRASIEQILNKASGAAITTTEMAGISVLTVGSGISSITGLEHATGLTSLNLYQNNITNIDSLYTLTNLRTLNLYRNNITNIDSLYTLTSLTSLNLGFNNITNIDSLYTLTNLTSLRLYRNNITNIDSLYTLTNLRTLNLQINNITNIDSLYTLTNLTGLTLHENSITDISPLRNLSRLTYLNLRSNNITDISPLMHLTSLNNYLILDNNNITNVDSLSTLTNLPWLQLSGNQNLSDISPLSTLTNLTRLYISFTSVSDISSLSTLTSLDRFEIHNTLVSDLSVVSNFRFNEPAFLHAGNSRISDISALVSHPRLTTNRHFIYLQGNPLSAAARTTQLTALANKGVWLKSGPSITLALSSSEIDESGATNQTVITATIDNMYNPSATTITVSATPGANAVAGDFTLSSNPVLIIAVGATVSTGTVTITAVDDEVRSDDKTVTISATTTVTRVRSPVYTSQGVTPPLAVSLTIRDDGDPLVAMDDVEPEPPVENKVPDFTDAVDFQRYQQGTPITPLIFPEVQSGDGELTYTLGGGAIPAGLTYTPPSDEDAHGGVLSGTPT